MTDWAEEFAQKDHGGQPPLNRSFLRVEYVILQLNGVLAQIGDAQANGTDPKSVRRIEFLTRELQIAFDDDGPADFTELLNWRPRQE